MGNGVRKLRNASRMSQAEAAERLGIKVTELSQFERDWHELPVRLVRDMAILFETNAASVRGSEIPVTEWKNTPYAAGHSDPEELYGSLGLVLAGKELDYPIGRQAREGLLSALEDDFNIMELKERRAWLTCSTLNNRILFINPNALKQISLRSDDDVVTAHYAHPEVYRAMQDWHERGSEDWGPVLTMACKEHVEELGEEVAVESVSQVFVLFADGTQKDDPYYLTDDWAVNAFCALDGHSFHIPANAMLLVDAAGYHIAEFVNLSHVALMDIPREEFHRRSVPE